MVIDVELKPIYFFVIFLAAGCSFDTSIPCADGELQCGATCVDIARNIDNCGACGVRCGLGYTCEAGSCTSMCGTGEQLCEGLCIATAQDVDNCGDCGVRCDLGYNCEAGACRPFCATGEQFCDGACIDPNVDRNYCGATDCANGQLGEVCAPNHECNGGTCVCDASEYTECGPGLCVDLQTDIDSCGTCGTVCETANGASCINGICRAQVTYAGTLEPQNGRWEFGGNIGLPAGDAECEANWPNSTVCTRIELVYAGEEGELAGVVDVLGNPVVSWWNNDDDAGDDVQCVYTTMENVRWSYLTAHVGNGGSYFVLQPDGTLSDLRTDAVCPDTHAVACCYRAVAIE